jgi:phage terminase large subunit
MTTTQIRLPKKLIPVFSKPLGAHSYRYAYGGRGSGKSFNFATMAAVFGYMQPIRVLCGRDLQVTIKESFHQELKSAISNYPWLEQHYDVGVDYLRGKNGTEFLFRGLRHNTGSIKSLAKIDLTIIEEAEDVTEESWLALEATVFRQSNSELWAIWNSRTENSPVDKRFVKSPPANSVGTQLNYYDNPYFPEGLEVLRKRQQETLDSATYAHIWEGAYLTNSNAQVLAGKVKVQEFKPEKDWDGAYYGMDFGFAQDPTTAVKCWIANGNLYVEQEAYKIGLELDDTANYIKAKMPEIDQYTIRADCARPESISYLRRHGLSRIIGVEKWAGSVQDGIQFMRSFNNIIIHPRCEQAIREARLYSYKVDRLTGDILPQIVDDNNHIIDACFSGDTKVIVNNKLMRFDEIPKEGLIKGFDGVNRKYTNGGAIRCDKILHIVLSNGNVVKATSDHEFLTTEGWVKAENLKGQLLCESLMFHQMSKFLTVNLIICIMGKSIYQKVAQSYIEKFGNFITVKFQKTIMYTTLMKILKIIKLRTLWLLKAKFTLVNTLKSFTMKTQNLPKKILKKTKINVEHGINRKTEKNGILSIMKILKTSCMLKFGKIANLVISNFMATLGIVIYFVQTLVNQNGVEILALIMSKENVANVAKYLAQVNTDYKYIAVKDVVQNTELEKVYCVTIKNNESFALANNLVVSNCRYAIAPLIKPSKKVLIG